MNILAQLNLSYQPKTTNTITSQNKKTKSTKINNLNSNTILKAVIQLNVTL